MTIDFNFGQHLHTGSNGFFVELITTFFGAFLGFLFALHLNHKSEIKIKKKEEEKRKEELYETMKFLEYNIDSVIDFSTRQMNNYMEYSENVKNSPYSDHLPSLLVTYSFDRLKSFDSKMLLESYELFFGNSELAINDFMKMFSRLDYLQRIFIEFEKETNKRQEHFYNYQDIVIYSLDSIAIKVGLRHIQIERDYPESFSQMEEYQLLDFFAKKYRYFSDIELNLKIIKDEYLVPLHDPILTTKFERAFAESIFTELKRALNQLNRLEYVTIFFSNSFNEKRKNVENSIEYLSELKDKIHHLERPCIHDINREVPGQKRDKIY